MLIVEHFFEPGSRAIRALGVVGVTVANPSTSPVTVTLYTPTRVGGNPIFVLQVPANDTRTVMLPEPVPVQHALDAVWTGTGVTVTVYLVIPSTG